VVSMTATEPAAKKAKVDVFAKHSVCLILDYGVSVRRCPAKGCKKLVEPSALWVDWGFKTRSGSRCRLFGCRPEAQRRSPSARQGCRRRSRQPAAAATRLLAAYRPGCWLAGGN
jgi:hypothetical protein